MTDASPTLALDVRYDEDIVAARQRARHAAQATHLSLHAQIGFATAVSEVARNALRHAGSGRVELSIESRDDQTLLVARVRDRGPGIATGGDAAAGGRGSSHPGGLTVARRLSDWFDIETTTVGTTVSIGMRLSRRGPNPPSDLRARLAASAPLTKPTPIEELRHQNRELFAALEELERRKAEVERLASELAETNRGVVALYAELDDKADTLRQASALKSRFLSDLSHELRTPLNATISLTGLLLARVDGELTTEQERQVMFIRRSSESLLEMVNGLLDLAKIEAGRTEVLLSDFDVADVLAAARGMFRPLVGDHVTLRIEDPSEPIRLHCDEGRLSQIVRNLIANALKFTERGEVVVSAARGGDDEMRLTVRDTGIGIAADDHERIFDDFTQVDGFVQRRVRGTGLGLPLARKLARLLGGDVTVRSQPGAGSIFTVTLPINCAGGKPASDAALPEMAPPATRGPGA
jgi:signal transduction histidine kinase